MRSGRKTTGCYQLFVLVWGARPFTLAERLASRAEADVLRDADITCLGVNSERGHP